MLDGEETPVINWFGDLPIGWTSKKLKYVAAARNERQTAAESSLRYVGLENIHSWSGLLNETESEPEGLAAKFYRRDVLFGKLRPYLAKVYSAEFEGLCSTEALVLCPKITTARYLFYSLISQPFIELISSSVFGAKMPRASWDFIGQQPVPIPDLDTQNRIVRFLDERTSEIDSAIAKKRRLIDLLSEQKAILINRAVTKGLDPDAPMKDSGVDWIGEIPAHWEVKRLKYMTEILPGYAFSSSKFSEAKTATRLLRGVNINPGRTVWNETVYWPDQHRDEHSRYVLNEGDLVMGMDRPWVSSGVRVARIKSEDLPALLVQRVARIRAKSGHSTGFLELLITSRRFLEYFEPILSGVSVPHISDGQIGNFATAIPGLSEQVQIADYSSGVASEFETLIERENVSIATLTEFKQTLIANAVTGKIRI